MCRKCAPSSRIHMKYSLYDITTWLFVVSGDHSWSCFTDSEQKANSEISKVFIQDFTPKMDEFQWLFSKFDIYEKTGPSLPSCKPTPVLFVCRGIKRTTRLNSFPRCSFPACSAVGARRFPAVLLFDQWEGLRFASATCWQISEYLKMMWSFKSVRKVSETSPKAHIETNQLWTAGFDGKFPLPPEMGLQDR